MRDNSHSLTFRVELDFSYDDKHPSFVVQTSSLRNSKIGRDKKERKNKWRDKDPHPIVSVYWNRAMLSLCSDSLDLKLY